MRKTRTFFRVLRAWEIGRLRRCEGMGEKVKIHCPLIGSKNANRPHSCLESRLFPTKVCAANSWITQILLMSNPVLSGHDLCFDRTGQWGLALKHGTRGVKMIQNTEGSSLTLRQKKLSVKYIILIFYISCLRG